MKTSFISSLYCMLFFVWICSPVKAERRGICFCPGYWLAIGTALDYADTTANKKIIAAYLSALKNFDHQKMKSFNHPSMPFSDNAMKGFRDFERNTGTKWHYRIVKANEDSVFAEEKEENLFYDCLGIGERTQVYCYLLKDGLIFQTIQISMHHLHGEYKPAYARFLSWLQSSPAKDDSLLLKNNNLVFDGNSAVRMKPWLMRWKQLNKK